MDQLKHDIESVHITCTDAHQPCFGDRGALGDTSDPLALGLFDDVVGRLRLPPALCPREPPALFPRGLLLPFELLSTSNTLLTTVPMSSFAAAPSALSPPAVPAPVPAPALGFIMFTAFLAFMTSCAFLAPEYSSMTDLYFLVLVMRFRMTCSSRVSFTASGRV